MGILEVIAGFRSFRGTLACVAVVAGVSLPGIWSDARAQIVALGASNTYGQGAGGPPRAYPARLQALLKAKGINVSVRNAGISGHTTSDMLARVGSAVPAGTKIVLLGACEGVFNNSRKGVSPAQGEADLAAINSRLKSRGIRVIDVCGRGLPRGPDNIHLSPAGQAMLASQVLPEVINALGK